MCELENIPNTMLQGSRITHSCPWPLGSARLYLMHAEIGEIIDLPLCRRPEDCVFREKRMLESSVLDVFIGRGVLYFPTHNGARALGHAGVKLGK